MEERGPESPLIYWGEYGRKWGDGSSYRAPFFEEGLSRKNREERTDGGARVVKDGDQLGQASSSGAPGPGSGWA